jgi:hypothetical protein
LQVRADQGAPIVAEVVRRRGSAQRSGGDAISRGVAGPAKSWIFGRSRVGGERNGVLALSTPGPTEARVSIVAVLDGAEVRPVQLQNVRVPAGRRVAVRLSGVRELARDAALIVTSDRPIIAERVLETASEMTRATGITVR